MTREIETVLAKLEGCACVARSDAETLVVGCERRGYFADVAGYNLVNVKELCKYVRRLEELLDVEFFQCRSIEDIPF